MELRRQHNQPPLVAIFIVSILALSYEVLLIRLFAMIQWHHFSYMIISVALLGYGASGSYLMIRQDSLKQNFSSNFISNVLLFSLTGISSFLLAQQLAFNPLELFWDKTQWVWLLLLYILFIFPFFFVANCIGLAFLCFKSEISRCYAADLTGAAVGAFAVVLMLYFLFPEHILQLLVSLSGFVILTLLSQQQRNKKVNVLAFLLIGLPWLLPPAWLQVHFSEYKPLSQTLQIIDTKLNYETSGPLGRISVVESPTIPFRHVPGLSLTNDVEPPPQLGLFSDGDGMTMITQYDGEPSRLVYLQKVTSALPYQILQNPSVLVLGAGGGAGVLQGLVHKAQSVDAVELNEQVVDLVKHQYANYSGNIYHHPLVRVHTAEARSFLTSSDRQFDVIQMELLSSFAASSAGLYALNESYLYTVEALSLYLQRLTEQGVLTLTRWVKLPPRDTLKLVATAKQALQQMGISQPQQHLALIRSWNTATLIVKKTPLSAQEIEKIFTFCDENSFDLAYYPNIKAEQTNRYNRLPEPYFYAGSQAILSENEQQFLENYKYNLTPATDNKPYFFDFLKWRYFFEIITLPASQGLALMEWGGILLALTLLQAIVVSLVLILIPLWWYYRKHVGQFSQKRDSAFVAGYFSLLGIAFMFVEIAFIQKFILFLGHPIYALSVVLAGFLLFAGLGSYTSKRWPIALAMKMAVAGICSFSVLYLLLLPTIFHWFISANDVLKIFISLLLIFPLAFFMGMPFPIGLSLLSEFSPQHIAWAWGINGCASVISAISATLVALNYGFNAVVILAVVCYLLAGILLTQKYYVCRSSSS